MQAATPPQKYYLRDVLTFVQLKMVHTLVKDVMNFENEGRIPTEYYTTRHTSTRQRYIGG